jgi:hypothetical protein
MTGETVFQTLTAALSVGPDCSGFGVVFSLKVVSDHVSETRCAVIISIIFIARGDEQSA